MPGADNTSGVCPDYAAGRWAPLSLGHRGSSEPPSPLPCLGAIVTLVSGYLMRSRSAQWIGVQWRRRGPRTAGHNGPAGVARGGRAGRTTSGLDMPPLARSETWYTTSGARFPFTEGACRVKSVSSEGTLLMREQGPHRVICLPSPPPLSLPSSFVPPRNPQSTNGKHPIVDFILTNHPSDLI